MEGDDQPPGVFAGQQMALQGQAVRGADGHILPGQSLQRLHGLFPGRGESAVRFFLAGDIEESAVAGNLPVHGQIRHGLAGPAAHRRRAHADPGQGPQSDGRRCLFLHGSTAFPIFPQHTVSF